MLALIDKLEHSENNSFAPNDQKVLRLWNSDMRTLWVPIPMVDVAHNKEFEDWIIVYTNMKNLENYNLKIGFVNKNSWYRL